MTDVYAYFRSRLAETEFEKAFAGGSVRIEAKAIEFSPGVGAVIREITAWDLSSTKTRE